VENKYGFPLFYWHLELASKCALSCPRCPRTGPENQHKYAVTEMPLEKLQSIFTPELLKSEVKKFMLCGGQGDPIYYSKLHEFIEYVRTQNSQIEFLIVTNGSYRKKEWWEKLSSLLTEEDRIVFSIDGWDQESNEKYRKGSDFESIMQGLEVMTKGRANVHWSTIVFSFNQDHLSRIRDLAVSKGVHHFEVSRSTKFGSAWAGADGVDQLQPREEFLVSSGPYIRAAKTLRPSQKKHSIVPLVNERKKQIGVLVPGCISGERGLYVDASGYLYSCSWISHPYDMQLNPGQKNIWLSEKEKFNVFERGLNSVLNDSVWEQLFATWTSQEKLYRICAEKCAVSCK
jgi:MoaA/NifB/PqqE/SkfB family radical SAM enzyme